MLALLALASRCRGQVACLTMLSCTRHPSKRMYASVQRGLMLPALALVSAFQSFGVASSGTAPMFVMPAPGQKGLCTHSQQWHKVGIIEFRQCAGNVHWTYGHVCVAHTLLCCHSPHACSCTCVTSWSTTPVRQHTRAHTHVVSGHFSISELRVIGVDTKHWWSNGLTIRGETEPPKRHQFTTVKGERDGSDVVFPGVYTYEAGRGRHGSGDGGRLWQCSGDGCYASVCSVLLTVGG